jgi:hypothetical protein
LGDKLNVRENDPLHTLGARRASEGSLIRECNCLVLWQSSVQINANFISSALSANIWETTFGATIKTEI